jgi:hypothetical protein
VTALVVALTVVVALLGLLVVSLLRSHAEILRRLHEIDPRGADQQGHAHEHGPTPLEMGVRPGVALPREHETAAHDVVGTTPGGDDVGLALVGSRGLVLLAFLSSGCLTCLEFWRAFGSDPAALPGGVRLVVVTKGPSRRARAASPSSPRRASPWCSRPGPGTTTRCRWRRTSSSSTDPAGPCAARAPRAPGRSWSTCCRRRSRTTRAGGGQGAARRWVRPSASRSSTASCRRPYHARRPEPVPGPARFGTPPAPR